MQVRKVVDLSVPLDESVQVYPGDPEFRSSQAATVAVDGFNLRHVQMGSQTGTHVDAPYHFAEDGLRIDELDLRLLAGPAVVLDVRGHGPRERITWADLEPWAGRLGPGVIALVHTGWSAHWGTPRYFEHPFLDADAVGRLLDLGVRTLLLDSLNPDETPDAEHPGEGFPVHHLVAGVGGVIGENLRGLDQVDFEPFVSCLPLRLTGADGAPVRAVALDLAP